MSHQILYIYLSHFQQFHLGYDTNLRNHGLSRIHDASCHILLIPYPLNSQSASMSHPTPIDCDLIGSRTSPLGCCFAAFHQSRITQPLLGISSLQSRDASSMTLKIRMLLCYECKILMILFCLYNIFYSN